MKPSLCKGCWTPNENGTWGVSDEFFRERSEEIPKNTQPWETELSREAAEESPETGTGCRYFLLGSSTRSSEAAACAGPPAEIETAGNDETCTNTHRPPVGDHP